MRALGVTTLVYGGASLLHFAHNAALVREYPNLPAQLTAPGVVGAWLAVTAVGLCGWLALRRGYATLGLATLALYAALGFDGLGHYALAPMAAHTGAMNLTILTEAAAGAALLAVVGSRLAARREVAGAARHRLLQ
jgi:hypothetical protein